MTSRAQITNCACSKKVMAKKFGTPKILVGGFNRLCFLDNIFFFSWYHPGMTRNTAEVLLLANGVEGNFLVRPSQSNAGNFAVSVR